MKSRQKQGTMLYLIGLLLLVALLASVGLVMKGGGDVRKGAYFAGGRLFLQTAKTDWRVGDDIPIHLWAEVGPGVKVDNVAVRLCYSAPKLGFVSGGLEAEKRVSINMEAGFTSVPYVGAEEIENLGECLDLTVSSDKPAEGLPGGTFEVAVINFKAKGVGEREGIEFAAGGYKMSGDNPGSLDKAISVDRVEGVVISIGEAKEVLPTPTPTESVGPTATLTPTATMTPSPTPTEEEEAEAGQISFKLAFRGLKDEAAVCGQDWPVDVIVMGGGETRVFGQVGLTKTREKNSQEEVIWRGKLQVEGLGKQGLALFVKGPMHLQVKYGRDGQKSFYNQAGGELSLGKEYDFSEYPIWAGDVTGAVDGVPDGKIDGRDFVYVKSRMTAEAKRLSERERVNGDFNGDCWIGNMDLVILMSSLTEKQDQLY